MVYNEFNPYRDRVKKPVFLVGVKIMPVRNITVWNEPAINGGHAIDNFNYALFIGEDK